MIYVRQVVVTIFHVPCAYWRISAGASETIWHDIIWYDISREFPLGFLFLIDGRPPGRNNSRFWRSYLTVDHHEPATGVKIIIIIVIVINTGDDAIRVRHRGDVRRMYITIIWYAHIVWYGRGASAHDNCTRTTRTRYFNAYYYYYCYYYDSTVSHYLYTPITLKSNIILSGWQSQWNLERNIHNINVLSPTTMIIVIYWTV